MICFDNISFNIILQQVYVGDKSIEWKILDNHTVRAK